MRHLLRCLPVFLALAALPLRAQYDLTPSLQLELPAGHSYIIGLTPSANNLIIHTLDEIYELPLATPSYTKIASFRSLSVRPTPEAQIGVVPGVRGFWQVHTFDNDDTASLFNVTQTPPAQNHQILPGAWDSGYLALAMALTAGGQAYFIDDHHQLWRASDYQNLATLALLSGPISDIARLSLGANGVLYALDSHNQVFRFSADGTLLNQYTLSDGTGYVTTPEFLVSSSDILFSFNRYKATDGRPDEPNSDYGGIYNAVTGDYLGRFYLAAGDEDDPQSQGGKPSMALLYNSVTNTETLAAITGTGRYLWIYDVTSVTAIPEPSTYAAAVGFAVLGFAALRRRSRGPAFTKTP